MDRWRFRNSELTRSVVGYYPALIVLFVLTGIGFLPISIGAETAIDFGRDIRPILSDRCFFCHGPDAEERKADLRLDIESEAKSDRSGVAAIVEGKPDQSELIARIQTHDLDDRMPPEDSGKVVSADEIELLKRWISEGAAWSDHWAYRLPVPTPAPAVQDVEWPRNWIDHWVLSELENQNLTPSDDASLVTIVRRLSFDLCGLAPEPELVAQFQKDPSRLAYDRLIDSLLESPQFGERMAIYWLDLVRFADTVGYHGDQDQNISPYRDYVIDAFNENLPFDQFTRDQLAGDLGAAPSIDQRIATGYNRLLQTSHEGGVQQKEYLAIYAADRVRNVSGVWLGATMGCAQCHDHKYDPITSKDFYAMQAFFADVDETKHFKNGTNDLPTRREPEIEVKSKRERAVLAAISDEIASIEKGIPPTFKDIEDLSSYRRLLWLREKREALDKKVRKVMVTQSVEPRQIRLLPRGNWLDNSGMILDPAVPEFLGELALENSRRATRLDLANWLTDAESGVGLFTARVFVNRFWFLMFGSGLSRSLDDFGGQGEPPYYGDLLDQLALEFVASGWDVKHMFRLIAQSRAYQQGSAETPTMREQDPYNRLLARQARFRLPAESVRDSLLQISGLLNDEIGGPSVKPYQPEGYYRHLNFPARQYKAHLDGRQWRRGVYVHWQRQFLHPMLAAFDAPSREECTAERAVSNTPVAALVLLNDPTFVEAAVAFAKEIESEGGKTIRERISFAFRRALSRNPDQAEIDLLGSLLVGENHRSDGVGSAGSGQQDWVLVARAILNLSETITRQ
jgi:hypothetical protein